jgi:hypothetical protein
MDETLQTAPPQLTRKDDIMTLILLVDVTFVKNKRMKCSMEIRNTKWYIPMIATRLLVSRTADSGASVVDMTFERVLNGQKKPRLCPERTAATSNRFQPGYILPYKVI